MSGLPRAAMAQAERDRAILDEDWTAAARLSEELGEIWGGRDDPRAAGFFHSADIYKDRVERVAKARQ